MRVLGIDPGLRCTGYGIIEIKKRNIYLAAGKINRELNLLEAGVIKTSTKEKLTNRLHKIYCGLQQVGHVYRPDCIALEQLYSHYGHPRTAILMAHARGIIYLVAAGLQIDVVGYSAKRVKKAVVGTGGAKKSQVQKVIKEILGLKQEPAPNDVADALALAITHINIIKRGL